jgi:S1-C subfamily serine protease
MNSLVVCLLATCLAACSHPVVQAPATQDRNVTVALMKDWGPGEDGGWHSVCAGTWVAPEWILTANHCTVGEGDDETKVLTEIQFITEPASKVRRRALVSFRDEDHDLALLHAETFPPHPAASLAPFTPYIGSTMHVVGHPHGFQWTYFEGPLSGFYDPLPHAPEAKGSFLQIQVPIVGGNSGGGAFDDYGQLVGVCDLGFSSMPGEGFFISVEEVRHFMHAAGLL